MKVLIMLLLAGVTIGSQPYEIYSMDQAEDYFENFINTYDKQYADEAEKKKKFEVFKQSLLEINKKNLENTDTVYGITKFADLTREEFINKFTGLSGDNTLPEKSECATGTVMNSTAVPESWDWRDQKIVTKVKAQGDCGACWAFSAIGNVESQYALKYKTLLDLSEQQVVDCDKRSFRCMGTDKIYYPFVYLTESSGAMLEKDYPYQGKNGSCKFDAAKVKAKVYGCVIFTPKTEEELKKIVYYLGPVTIGLDAIAMQNYKRGVLKNCPYLWTNHAVLIVGFGTEDKTPYWLIKNSWGETFGENGFIKIQRGVDACGLMKSYVVQALVS